MKRRILIIYTGGTIGMALANGAYVPVQGFRHLLYRQLKTEAAKQLPDYELIEFDELIDSANLHPADWTHLGRLIETHWADYHGFIVLHGTDTLAYTASALSFMFQGISKPIMITGSQIPLSELRNDALDNLLTALIIQDKFDAPGVSVYFNGRLLRGNRCVKMNSKSFDAFDSPNFPWLAKVGINIDIDQTLFIRDRKPRIIVPEYDPLAVVPLQVYPGVPAGLFGAVLKHPNVKGLILQTYGVGNAPGKDKVLLNTIQQAVDRGIAILNITQCTYGSVDQEAYATGAAFNQLGVIGGSDLTLEAAFTKMHFLLACGYADEALSQKLRQPLCGECAG